MRYTSKKQAKNGVLRHAKQRTEQRYGFTLEKHILDECLKKIKYGQNVLLLEHQSRTRKRFLIRLNSGVVVHAIYSSTFKSLVTVLELEWIPSNLQGQASEWINGEI